MLDKNTFIFRFSISEYYAYFVIYFFNSDSTPPSSQTPTSHIFTSRRPELYGYVIIKFYIKQCFGTPT